MGNFSLNSNLHIIEVNGSYIVYAPLQGLAFSCSTNNPIELKRILHDEISSKLNNKKLSEYIEQIKAAPIKYPKLAPDIDTKDHLVIILSHKCNLACSYCYAQSSRSTKELDIKSVKTAIDFILEQESQKPKIFTFIGGGEPLITWDLLTQSINYILKRTTQQHIKYQIRIITNATLLSNQYLDWLSLIPNISINVSSDILQDIQDTQRPTSSNRGSFELVHRSLNRLAESKIPFSIRSTITLNNVGRMDEMAEFAINNYKGVKRLHFEPVTDNDIDNEFFLNTYVENFIRTLSLCETRGVRLVNSFISAVDNIKEHFCAGEFCIVPGNKIIACHRHSSIDDPFFGTFEYGCIQEGKVKIDQNKMKEVISFRKKLQPDCEFCFAKWHCAGGCASIKATYSLENKKIHCNFVRAIIANYIYYKLKQ